MAITDIYPRPLVTKVIFEVRYPNLFFLENRIGDLQMALMTLFPDARVLHRRGFILADVAPGMNLEHLKDDERLRTAKVWEFINEKGYKLNILPNKFDITSEFHKTYNLGDENKFRDIIEKVLKVFLSLIDLPKFNRVGLRYIDHGPIPEKTNEVFNAYYNSVFPTSRFSIDDASEMIFSTVSKRGDHNITYTERLIKENDKYKLMMDFDAFAVNVKSNECLSVTDELRDIVSREFKDKLKAPIIAYMEQKE